MNRSFLLAAACAASVVVSALFAPPPASTASEPDGGPAAVAPSEGRISGGFVGRVQPGETRSVFAVGDVNSADTPMPAVLYDSLDGALGAAADWEFPALDTTGPITGSVNGRQVCLQPNPLEPYKYVYPAACNGQPAQQWVWGDVHTPSLSGMGLVSGGGQGGYLRQWDGYLAVGGNGVVADAAVILPDGRDPRPAVDELVLEWPVPGTEVRTPLPTFSGRGEADSTIEVRAADNSVIGSGTVAGDGRWAVTLTQPLEPGASAGEIRQVIDGATVPWSLTYRAVSPVVVTEPALDARVDVARPVFSGSGEPGASVTVVESRDGVTLVDTVVDRTGAWSQQSLRALDKRSYEATATQQFEDQRSTAPVRFTYGDPAPIRGVTLESPATGATIATPRPVFTGRGEPGATVRVIGQSTDDLGSGIVRGDGTWTIEWNKTLIPGQYRGGWVQQEIAGEVQSRAPYDFRLVFAETPLRVISPGIGDPIKGSVPTFTGTAQPGARVEIVSQWGARVGWVDRVGQSGAWTITWDRSLLPARYFGGTITQYVNGVAAGSVRYDFTVTKPLVVSSPAIGGTVVGTRPTFVGTGTPGAKVAIIGAWGTDLGSETVDSQGRWTITWPRDYRPGNYSGGRVVQSLNGITIDDTFYDFTLEQ
jgi:hypothetical protein